MPVLAIVATAAIGEQIAYLTTREMDFGQTWNLNFENLYTKTKITLEFDSEDKALKAFAAWIAADEPDGKWFTRAYAELDELLPTDGNWLP